MILIGHAVYNDQFTVHIEFTMNSLQVMERLGDCKLRTENLLKIENCKLKIKRGGEAK